LLHGRRCHARRIEVAGRAPAQVLYHVPVGHMSPQHPSLLQALPSNRLATRTTGRKEEMQRLAPVGASCRLLSAQSAN
jgi:hypothetical protein